MGLLTTEGLEVVIQPQSDHGKRHVRSIHQIHIGDLLLLCYETRSLRHRVIQALGDPILIKGNHGHKFPTFYTFSVTLYSIYFPIISLVCASIPGRAENINPTTGISTNSIGCRMSRQRGNSLGLFGR